MSHTNLELYRENKTYYPSNNGIFKESPLYTNNKINHIIIDSDLKNIFSKNNGKSKEIKIFKLSSPNSYRNGLKNKKNIEEVIFAQTCKNDKEAIKSLKKRILELNSEIKKLRKHGTSVENLNVLDLNNSRKSKELKQENLYNKFQLQDIKKKNTNDNNNIKKNNNNNNILKKKRSITKLANLKDYHIKLYFKKKDDNDNNENNDNNKNNQNNQNNDNNQNKQNNQNNKNNQNSENNAKNENDKEKNKSKNNEEEKKIDEYIKKNKELKKNKEELINKNEEINKE
jgi:hypothetical protein